jgi:hypothetical protein
MRFAFQLTAPLLVGILIATIGTGCASPTRVELDEDADFSRYQTWGWQPTAASAEGGLPSALDVQVAAQVQRSLRARGLRYAADDPDLQVTAHLEITREQVTQHTTPALRRVSSFHASGSYDIQITETEVQLYERGRLVVAVIDARQHRQVWRGKSEARHRDVFRPHLDEMIAGLVGQFPMSTNPAHDVRPSMIAHSSESPLGPSGRSDP